MLVNGYTKRAGVLIPGPLRGAWPLYSWPLYSYPLYVHLARSLSLGESAGSDMGYRIAQVIGHLHQVVTGAAAFLYPVCLGNEAAASGNSQVCDL